MTAIPEAEGTGADSVHWIFKNKEHGKTSATASLGLITLWDVEGGLPQIDKYLYSQDPAVVAGALLGVGLINSGVQVCNWLNPRGEEGEQDYFTEDRHHRTLINL